MANQLKILLVEPYFAGSHKEWAEGYKKYSQHHVEILSLKGRFWKWRMHGGAVTLARKFLESEFDPDVIFATDMLDLTTFLSLTRSRTANTPVVLYFHENQICYPWSPTDRDVAEKRDRHYGFINYASVLASDRVFFNSDFHREAFFDELPKFLKYFPDNNELASIKQIQQKSSVLFLGLDLSRFDQHKTAKNDGPPIILWNHRWEYDKNPKEFFKALYSLQKQGLDFRVVLLGENFGRIPGEFREAQKRLGDKILHYGYAKSFEDYARWLWKADILPVTSNHEFFGAAVAEAVYCGCVPLLPKRLSYPDLFPLEKYQTCFYNDYSEFQLKLANLVKGHFTAPSFESVGRFRWENLAPEYDRLLEDMSPTG